MRSMMSLCARNKDLFAIMTGVSSNWRKSTGITEEKFQKRGGPRSKNTTTGEPCESGPPREQITEWNSKDRNAPIRAVEKTTNHSRASCFKRSRMTSRPHRLKKTSSMQSKRRDLHHTWLHRETNEKLSFTFKLELTKIIILLSRGG